MTSGSRCTWAGRPSAILRPKSRTTTLSEIGMTSPMWCSTSRMVTPRRSRIVRSSAASTATSSWFRPPAGSSTRSSAGAPARARQLDALERAERQPGGGVRGDGRQVEEREQLARALADLRLLAPHPRQAQRVAEEVAARATVDADHHVLEHGERREQREVLEGAADAEVGDAVRRQRQQRAVAEADVPPLWRVEPAQAVEQRRLAGAVGADEPDDLALGHVEGDAVERDDASEADGEITDGENRLPRRGHARAYTGRAGPCQTPGRSCAGARPTSTTST